MKRIRLVAVVALSLMAVIALLVTGVQAQTAPRGSWPQQRQQVQDARAKRITERIETIITRFNNNKDRHFAAYEAVKTRLGQMVTELASKGYDVTKLKSDLQAFDGLVVKFGQDYATFISLLQATEQYAPYASQGQFLTVLDQARAQLMVVRQDSLDARNYYQTVIRPDVQAVRNRKPQSTTPASTTP